MRNLFFFFLFAANCSFGQQAASYSDSIEILLQKSEHDSLKVNLLDDWSGHVLYSDPEKSQKLTVRMDSICRHNLNRELNPKERTYFENKWLIVQSYQGEYFMNRSEHATALSFFSSSLGAAREKNDRKNEAIALGNIGLVYSNMSDYSASFNYYEQSLKINEQTHDSTGISINLLNMGLVFYFQENFDKALNYFKDSYVICEEIDSKNTAKRLLNNIGGIYFQNGQIDSAEVYFEKSLVLSEELGLKSGKASSLMNLGAVSHERGDYEQAMNYFTRSSEICKELGDESAMIEVNINFANTHRVQENFSEGIRYSNLAFAKATEFGNLMSVKESANILAECYESIGDTKNALKYYKIFVQSRDSILDLESQQNVLQKEAVSEYEKQHLADSLDFLKQQEINQIAHDKDMEREANQRYLLYGGIGVLLLVGFLIFRGYQRKKKDNDIIAAQKNEVEEQKANVELAHQDIKDSIKYAKRIQSAILPNSRIVSSLLSDSFIYYQPKDVVAGDFYWLQKSGDTTLFAAADCTGHGVPGALVSVVCNAALNRAVRELKLTEPGQILDEVRRIVIEDFNNSDENVKDGMDISLCALEGMTLKFAGANNPLWILRQNELIEFKGDKQPVGKFEMAKSFKTHEISLQTNDQLYIFSDGFVDQFGGPKGKKFKAKALRDLIIQYGHKSMDEQKIILKSALDEWMGDLEQLDDICLIGVRV